jgi:hypothetical protein
LFFMLRVMQEKKTIKNVTIETLETNNSASFTKQETNEQNISQEVPVDDHDDQHLINLFSQAFGKESENENESDEEEKSEFENALDEEDENEETNDDKNDHENKSSCVLQ